MSRHIVTTLVTSLVLLTSACSTNVSDAAKHNITLSGETHQPEIAGATYTGPQYTIGIAQFKNKTPAKVTGIGEAATSILRTQLEAAGLKTILLDDEGALKASDKITAAQKNGVLKVGKNNGSADFDAPDYRLSGAITTYSEAEEGTDTAMHQKISAVARITIDYTLIDVATGKPLVDESATGEYRKTATGALGLDSKSNFDAILRDSALRVALVEAVEKLIKKLNSMPYQGKILTIDNQLVVLKAGTRSQLSMGTQLNVYHISEVLVDPDYGQVLGYKETKIGVVQISRHQNENLSEAIVVSGSGFKIGDLIKP